MGLMEGQTISTAAKVKDKDAGDVGKFLNRILGQSVEKQKMVCIYVTWIKPFEQNNIFSAWIAV